MPGTPLLAREYSDIPETTVPESFKNISLFESEGAFSLWSRLMYCPLEKAATKNPPPPRLPLLEDVTAKAKPTATAASIALPPLFRIEIPASDACLLVDTTMPFSPKTGSGLAPLVREIN